MRRSEFDTRAFERAQMRLHSLQQYEERKENWNGDAVLNSAGGEQQGNEQGGVESLLHRAHPGGISIDAQSASAHFVGGDLEAPHFGALLTENSNDAHREDAHQHALGERLVCSRHAQAAFVQHA